MGEKWKRVIGISVGPIFWTAEVVIFLYLDPRPPATTQVQIQTEMENLEAKTNIEARPNEFLPSEGETTIRSIR